MGTKSRKNRKKSKQQSSTALKWLLVTCGLLAVVVFIGIFVIKNFAINFLKSDSFRDYIITAMEEKLHADIDLQQLRWEGSTVYADTWRAQGHADAAFSKIEMDGMRATLDGVEDAALQIPEIRINQVSLEFSKQKRAGAPSTEVNAPSGDTKTSSSPIPSWLKNWVPNRVETGIIHVGATNLTFRDEQGTQQLALTSVETQSKPMSSPGSWEIQARNGQLSLANFPTLSIRKFETRWNHNDIFINQAELVFYDSAEISGSGDILLGSRPELNLDLKLSNLDTANLLSADWKKKITGTLHGDFTIKGEPGKRSSLISKGELQLKNGVIEGLPMLELIATYTKMQRFKRLALHQASADFVKKGDRIEISKLILQSDGLTRLEGSFTLENRQISNGKFRLGVTPGTLRWIPGAEQKVFTQAQDGFLWTPLVISGSLDQPKEDLTARLTGAAIETLVNDAPAQATDAAKKILSNPSDAINTGKKLIDSLIPLLK